MSNFKKILIPFDDNIKSIAAFEYAAMFASGIGAKITALHLADPKNYHTKAEFQKDLTVLVDCQLRPKLASIQKDYPDIKKIDIQIRGIERPIYEHIIDFAKNNEIDFIIMKSHGKPDKNEWEPHFKSTNAYKVVLDAPCPVFTFTHITSNPKLRNILVPLDMSEGSLDKLPLAIKLAMQFHAKLHLLTASEHREDIQAHEEQLDEIFNDFIGRGINVTKNKVYSDTLPAAIDRYVKNVDIDLVMVMSRPGFRWSDIWMSPKAKRIISHSKVPVVSIRSNKPSEAGL
jgi:nucleotide-binding universal stress UspA family protein